MKADMLPKLRFMLDYHHVQIERLSPNPTTCLTPLGARIGQAFDTIVLRPKLAI